MYWPGSNRFHAAWLTGLLAAGLGACHTNDTQPATGPNQQGFEGAGREKTAGDEASAYLLTAPVPDLALAGPPTPAAPAAPGDGWTWVGRSISRDLPIYNSTRSRRFEIGGLRLGSLVRLRPGSARGNCRAGWFEIEPRGYVCMGEGLRVSRTEVPRAESVLTGPDANAELPFRFVHVKDRGAYLFGELPSDEQRQAVRDGDDELAEELRARSMDGAFFLAIEGDPAVHPEGWLKTLHGNYIRAELTDEVPPSKLQGSLLDEELQLPLAFVIEDGAPVLEKRDNTLLPIGTAQRYARVPVDPQTVDDDFVRIRGTRRYLQQEHVRTATPRPQPRELEAGDRWVHVDIDSQTLTAYEGTEPRFATLIASGLSPRDTPTGEYHARYKYRTTTMRGEDEDGPFEVQEVPWTIFYYRSYAIHGAYWHDAFGAPRSHGCTNMAPLDARWLFHFTDPDLPSAWERSSDKGTRLVFTGSTSDA